MRLNERIKQIRQKLSQEHSLNMLALPQIIKVTINVGIGDYKDSKEMCETIEKEFKLIVGQKPRTTSAKVSISSFKTRKGEKIGYSATLRGRRMWDFIERLTSVVLPRRRDFSGIAITSFDTNNNLSFGIADQSVFPEIDPNEIKFNWGMGVVITCKNANDKELVREYLKEVGFIFKSN